MKTLLLAILISSLAQSPQTPTPLDPGVIQNYDYVNAQKTTWREAETKFREKHNHWQTGRVCSPEFFALVDNCSPRFQSDLSASLVDSMKNRGWQPLYWDLQPTPDEQFKPYCNNPECEWCIKNDTKHIVKIKARVEHRLTTYKSQTWGKSRRELTEPVFTVPNIPEGQGIRLQLRVIPIPQNAEEPEEIVPAKDTNDGPTAVAPQVASGAWHLCRGVRAVTTKVTNSTYVTANGQTHHVHKGEHTHRGSPGHRLKHHHSSHTTTNASGAITSSSAVSSTVAH